jgi:prevent-host-death family protein
MSSQSVGAYEAKTHLAQLLDRVVAGEHFVITRHGKAVAQLAPLLEDEPADPSIAVAELRRFRRGRRSGEP